MRCDHTQTQAAAASLTLDPLVLLSRTAPPCQTLAAAEVKAHPQASEVLKPLKKNQETSVDEHKAKQKQPSGEQTRPPQEGNQVQQSRVEDRETTVAQQVHQSFPLEKAAPPAGQRNPGSSSSGLRKAQSVQSLLTSTGKRDGRTRPDWSADLLKI